MKQTANILVLMAVYNGSAWILEQIDSVLAQEDVNVYLVINDDHSSDISVKLMNEKYSKLKNVEINQSFINGGSAAKNFYKLLRSVDIARYDYVALCDQDDIWLPDKLRLSIEILSEVKFCGYSSAVNAKYEDGTIKLLKQSSKKMVADFLFEGAGQGCTFVLPISSFKLIQNFCLKNQIDINDFYYHDWLIYLLVRSWDGKWFFDQNSSMYYRQHQNNDTGSRGTLLSIIKRVEKIRNGWYKNQIAIAVKIYFLAANHKNNLILSFSKIFNEKDSIKRRFLVTKFLWLHGRRRFSDRVVMALASLLGYI